MYKIGGKVYVEVPGHVFYRPCYWVNKGAGAPRWVEHQTLFASYDVAKEVAIALADGKSDDADVKAFYIYREA